MSRMLSAVGLTAAVLLSSSLAAQTRKLGADLDGSQEVTATGSSATGWAIIDMNDATLTVSVFVHTEGVAGTAAHVHVAQPGLNGPIVLTLTAGPNGSWTGSGVLSASDYFDIAFGDGYVNVHSAVFPGGEIRGQIGETTTEYFWAQLTGDQESTPTGSAATGTAIIKLHPQANVVTYDVVSSGLVNVSAAHIHGGPPGSDGGIFHGLIGGNGQYCNVTPKWTTGQLQALRAGNTYVNIHTTAFPGGEIRGQITPYEFKALCALLDESQETSPTGSVAQGSAAVRLLPGGTMIEYDVTVVGMSGTGAHIHTAPAGSNGPITVPLAGGPTHWTGIAPVSSSALFDGLQGNWYVNVHSAAFPGGEIRGQLQLAENPRTFGRGCVGSNGRRPELGADDPLLLGCTQRITVQGAPASTAGALLIGFSLFPQPVNLTLINVPNCFLHEVTSIDVPLTFDAAGCAQFLLPLPATAFGSVGLTAYLDCAIADFPLPTTDLTTTNMLRLEIGAKVLLNTKKK